MAATEIKWRWLRGTMAHGSSHLLYVNIYQATAILKENDDDYTIFDGNHIIKLYNCRVVDNLDDILPPDA